MPKVGNMHAGSIRKSEINYFALYLDTVNNSIIDKIPEDSKEGKHAQIILGYKKDKNNITPPLYENIRQMNHRECCQ